MRRWPIAGVLALTLVLAGCGSSSSTDSDAGTSGGDSGGKFDQTWSKQYSDTTCDEWLNKMEPKQRFVAAADMLVGARDQDGGKDLPPDSLIDDFKADIDEGCAEPTLSLTEVGASIYLIGRSKYRP